MNARMPDAAIVLSAMGAHSQVPADVHVFDKLDSTSAWLGEQRHTLHAKLEQGRAQLCLTDWQQAGVGRRGKSWQTQPGNVTFSVLARTNQPAQSLMGLSLITGLAVAEVLADVFGVKAMLKWPNDVIFQDRKLGGLLTEVMSVPEQKSSPAVTDVITGIGINVEHDDTVLGLGIGATSLRGAGIELMSSERDALVGRIAAAVLASHDRFLSEGWTAFASQWSDHDWLMGKEVQIHREHSTEDAVACGVNQHGALLVKSAGKILPLYGGNVSIRPKT